MKLRRAQVLFDTWMDGNEDEYDDIMISFRWINFKANYFESGDHAFHGMWYNQDGELQFEGSRLVTFEAS